ncbi:hypothetical protein [Cryptosporangium minutisporangium]|uniref:hypothetical protein n=1 Tax=Cryptosporangium minutisporangium TaxID=113569 RepID=UPI0031E987A9
MEPVDPVPGWSVPPKPASPHSALPPHPEGRPNRTRIVLLAGVVAVVLLGIVGVTTALVVRPDSEPTQLRAESVPSDEASTPGTPGAESDPGQAAAGQPPHPSTESSSTAGASPSTGSSAAAPAPSTGPAAPAPAPTSQAPTPKAPAPKPPTSKAPAPKPPASKKPTTKPPAPKPPAPKAPEINKAVAKSGTRGAGPCSTKLAAGYGCLQTYGDVWWVYDTKADSHSAVVFWEVGSGTAKRTGQCANSMGNGKIGVCNKNYAEGTKGRAKVCIMDWDTKQVHQCTAYFSFKTG